MSKALYVLVSDGGDGSYYPCYTFDKDFLDKLEASEHEDPDFDAHSALGFDGDGFHYSTLLVPDECTLESMGIHDCSPNYFDELFHNIYADLMIFNLESLIEIAYCKYDVTLPNDASREELAEACANVEMGNMSK